MSFDSVFNGDPTTANVSASGDASIGIDINSGQLYFRTPLGSTPGWRPVVGTGLSSGGSSIAVSSTLVQISAANGGTVIAGNGTAALVGSGNTPGAVAAAPNFFSCGDGNGNTVIIQPSTGNVMTNAGDRGITIHSSPSNQVEVTGELVLDSATPTVTSGKVGLGTTTSPTASIGASGAPPAQVLGYLVANLGGTVIKIPYYAA